MRQFYAYLYTDPRDGSAFYVGKGHGFRARKHLWKGPSGPVRDRIAAIRACGLEPALTVVECADEAEAFRLERTLIDALGRVDLGTGTLLNRTAGGQGSSQRKGFTHSEETKARIRASMKGRPLTEQHKARIGAANKGRPGPTAEHLAKMQEGLRRPDVRARNSERMKATLTPERQAEMTRRAAEATKGTTRSDETKARMSEAAKGRVYSDETLKRMSEGQKRRYSRG